MDRIPKLGEYDLVVVGAGSAGCAAALAAAQTGVGKVLLVERQGFLGGSSTGVLDTFYGYFTPGPAPKKVVGGIPDQVADLLDAEGALMLRANTYGAGTGVTYNPETLKWVWDRLMLEAGVTVWHHVLLVDVQCDSEGTIRELVLSSKRGFVRVAARRFIDASGDADLCHHAGVGYEMAGEHEPAQTLTTTFKMAAVDLKRFESEGGKAMLNAKMAASDLPRKKGSAHPMVIDGCIATVAVRVGPVDATDFEALSWAEQEGRRQSFQFERFFRDHVPGYERARIIGLSTGIGVRETRRVYGEYRLTRDDCLQVARFDDRVLLCGAPIEDHKLESGVEETAWAYVPEGNAYDVPYRTLVPKGKDELWVVGRCFSATHDAHASCRSMGQTMSMGQAAGVAAAISLKLDVGARAVPIPTLQDALRNLGAVLEVPSEVAATAAEAWSTNRTS